VFVALDLVSAFQTSDSLFLAVRQFPGWQKVQNCSINFRGLNTSAAKAGPKSRGKTTSNHVSLPWLHQEEDANKRV
jgi:hypothetical protein